MDRFTWILLVALAGALLPVQAGLNVRMGKAIESPVWAAFFSYVGGAVALLLYTGITKTPVSFPGLAHAPAPTWLAGLLGAFYVTVMVLAFPRLGPALTFGLVVGGQMLASILLDHFNILVHQPHPVNVYRIIGVLLVVSGVILIRKF